MKYRRYIVSILITFSTFLSLCSKAAEPKGLCKHSVSSSTQASLGSQLQKLKDFNFEAFIANSSLSKKEKSQLKEELLLQSQFLDSYGVPKESTELFHKGIYHLFVSYVKMDLNERDSKVTIRNEKYKKSRDELIRWMTEKVRVSSNSMEPKKLSSLFVDYIARYIDLLQYINLRSQKKKEIDRKIEVEKKELKERNISLAGYKAIRLEELPDWLARESSNIKPGKLTVGFPTRVRSLLTPDGDIASLKSMALELIKIDGTELTRSSFKPMVSASEVIYTSSNEIVLRSALASLDLWAIDTTTGEYNHKALYGHLSSINAVMNTPDKNLLTWALDGYFRLWVRAPDGNYESILLGDHGEAIAGVLIAPNGDYISYSSFHIKRWKNQKNGIYKEKTLVVNENREEPIRGVILTPEGEMLGWTVNRLLSWQKDKKGKYQSRLIVNLMGTNESFGAVLVEKGRIYNLSSVGNLNLRVWVLQKNGTYKDSVVTGHSGRIRDYYVTPNGDIITWGEDGSIRGSRFIGERLSSWQLFKSSKMDKELLVDHERRPLLFKNYPLFFHNYHESVLVPDTVEMAE